MDYWKKSTLKEMILNEDLNMEIVFKAVKEYRDNGTELERGKILKIANKYDMIINHYGEEIMCFEIDNMSYDTYKQPVKYKIIINDEKSITIDIISMLQLSEIVRQYNFRELKIFCPQCDNKYFFLKLAEFVKHETHRGACLKESSPFKKFSSDNFNSFFKEGCDFINVKLKPLEFEPNFKLYFKYIDHIIQSDELYFYEDKYQKRLSLFDKINVAKTGNKLVQFFGQPGKGKTLTLIGILKYFIKHDLVGTLYINCKAMSNLNEPFKLKQLFIDEIPFLFYNNFSGYIQCVNDIIDFIYDKNTSNYFDLVNLVIDHILKDKKIKNKYLIVLDQYNDKTDKDNNHLKELYKKLIQNKINEYNNIVIGLITFSSMNNKDIREYKIKHLFEGKFEDNFQEHYLEEVENLEYKLSIDNGGKYDQNLKKLGNGLKYYNILKYFYINKKDVDMEDFMNLTKFHIRTNLLDFFKIKDLSKNPKLNILGSFSTNVSYSKTNLNAIKENIPFKYFEIVKKEKKGNEDKYIIKFSFPLVGEAMNDIYSQIINTNPSLYSNITNEKQLDEGAKGKFFEKILTYYLNVQSSIYKLEGIDKVSFFSDYEINFHKEMEVLVLNDNETPEIISNKQNLQENCVYLLTQKRFNGKALDIALLKISEINEIIGIQASIHKKDIFSSEEIDKFLKNLRDNVKNNYDIEVDDNNLFFCYIFEWNKDINQEMIKKCKDKDIKFFFFDVTNKCFNEENGQKITNLKSHISKPSQIISNNKIFLKIAKKDENKYHSLDEYFHMKQATKINYNSKNFADQQQTKIIVPTFKGPAYIINEAQEKVIKNILKRDFNLPDDPKIKYICSMNCLSLKSKTGMFDFCILQDKNEKNILIMITKYNSIYFIKSNGDFCDSVTKMEQDIDCYEIL